MKAETLNDAIEYACGLDNENDAIEWIIHWELERANAHESGNLAEFNCYSAVYIPRIKKYFENAPDDVIDVVAFRQCAHFPYLEGDRVIKFLPRNQAVTRIHGTFAPIHLLPKIKGDKLLQELLKAKHRYQESHMIQVKDIEEIISSCTLTGTE